MTEIDARGLSCPEPVLLTAAALKSQPAELVVLVNDEAPRENVTRYAENHGYQVSQESRGEDYLLKLSKR